MHGLERLEELTEQLGLIETILANQDAVLVLKATGDLVYANVNAARMLGYDTPAEVMEKKLTDLMPERYRDLHNRGFKRRVEEGEGILLGKNIAVSALCANGDEISVFLWLQEQVIKGEKYYLGSMRDASSIVMVGGEITVSSPELASEE